MQKRVLVTLIGIAIILLVSGCTTPAPSAPAQQAVPGPQNTTESSLVQTSVSPVTPTVPDNVLPRNQSSPGVAPSPQRAEPDPFVNTLQLRKNYFSFTLPGCDMKEIFPAIAKDPEYGIDQTAPRLTTLSSAEIRDFITRYTEGPGENSRLKGIYSCQDVSMPPDWNFAEIRAVITPRNSRPADYEISLMVRKRAENITVYTTRENLALEQPVVLVRYIPMKTDEMELIDAAAIAFRRIVPPDTATPAPLTPSPPEVLDPNLLVFRTFSNQLYTIRYPETWSVENTTSPLVTVLKSRQGGITYTLTAVPRTGDILTVKTDRETYVRDVAGDYPGYLPENILRDFGPCSTGDTRSCMQYSVYLPDGRYAKKVFIATLNFAHEFRIQCPDDHCRNLGEYMTDSITVKDTRSN